MRKNTKNKKPVTSKIVSNDDGTYLKQTFRNEKMIKQQVICPTPRSNKIALNRNHNGISEIVEVELSSLSPQDQKEISDALNTSDKIYASYLKNFVGK